MVKDTFVANKIQSTLPQISIPPSIGTPNNVSTTIVDTSALPQHRSNLNKELHKCNVVLLVYSDSYSYERVALFWLPHFRSLGVNVPVVLCAAKADLYSNASTEQVINDEMLPTMAEFKEIDSCIRTSAREHHNINEAFFLCQKSVTDPIAPLFDSKDSKLKPACAAALRRIFYLCDKDKDGYWSDKEVRAFQSSCFSKPLGKQDLADIKTNIQETIPSGVTPAGISQDGFVQLCFLFAEKGRHETIWRILRNFHYTDSLCLSLNYLSPRFDVPSNTSSELSPAGYRFFVDLFLLFDKDTDGGLSLPELEALFAPAPGLPPSWLEDSSPFPSATTRNEAGHVTLQGWLAQWALTTFFNPPETLHYLAYLGYDPGSGGNNTSALTTTKTRRRPPRYKKLTLTSPPIPRSVFHAYILGPSGCGKSSLLNAFLSSPISQSQKPSDSTYPIRRAVNSVELPGGKQITLILSELSALPSSSSDSQSHHLLTDATSLQICDLLVYAYDSSDPDSFSHTPHLQETYPFLADLPELHLALKADKDKARQRYELQPEEWCEARGIAKPMHVSVKWPAGMMGEVFAKIAEGGVWPGGFYPRRPGEDEEENKGWMEGAGVWVGAGVVVAAIGVGLGIWKRLYP